MKRMVAYSCIGYWVSFGQLIDKQILSNLTADLI